MDIELVEEILDLAIEQAIKDLGHLLKKGRKTHINGACIAVGVANHTHLGVLLEVGRAHKHGYRDPTRFHVLLPEVQHGEHGVAHHLQEVLADHGGELGPSLQLDLPNHDEVVLTDVAAIVAGDCIHALPGTVQRLWRELCGENRIDKQSTDYNTSSPPNTQTHSQTPNTQTQNKYTNYLPPSLLLMKSRMRALKRLHSLMRA